MNADAGSHKKEAPTYQCHPEGVQPCHPEGGQPTKETTSADYTPNSSPQRTKTASMENSFYPGYSPVVLHGARQGDTEQYFQESNAHGQVQNDYYHGNASEFTAANSNEASSSMGQHENCMETTEEGLLFEDSSYGDEIARWMEDQRRFQQQQQLENRGEGCVMLTEPTNEALSTGYEGNNAGESGSVSEIHLKRSASQLSDSVLSEKHSAKRRQRSQSLSLSQSSPQSDFPDSRSSSRRRMDDALHERSQSQMALRDALLALETAKDIVRGCRSRFNSAKNLVEVTAKEECESLLQEDTVWNDMFHKLKEYKEETGDCNVKQNVARDGAEDNKTPPEMIRRLSAWVGKNRKEHKQRGTYKSSKINDEWKASDESDSEHMNIPSIAFSPDDSDGDMLRSDDSDPDCIHADPYKRVALDSIGFDWDPRNSRWNNMYEELRRYKDEHGVCDFSLLRNAQMVILLLS